VCRSDATCYRQTGPGHRERALADPLARSTRLPLVTLAARVCRHSNQLSPLSRPRTFEVFQPAVAGHEDSFSVCERASTFERQCRVLRPDGQPRIGRKNSHLDRSGSRACFRDLFLFKPKQTCKRPLPAHPETPSFQGPAALGRCVQIHPSTPARQWRFLDTPPTGRASARHHWDRRPGRTSVRVSGGISRRRSRRSSWPGTWSWRVSGRGTRRGLATRRRARNGGRRVRSGTCRCPGRCRAAAASGSSP